MLTRVNAAAPPHSSDRSAIVLVNLGTPDAPTRGAVRRYLKQFLWDRRVVELPRLPWWLLLHGVILPLRAGQSARKYASIWTSDGSPLMVNTRRQAALLGAELAARGHDGVRVVMAMRYGTPALPAVLAQLAADGIERVLVLPAYPQYSATTTGSINDAVFGHYAQVRNMPALRLVKHYHDHDGYLVALQQSVVAHWTEHGRGDQLVMSFHGVPSATLAQGDPYYFECHQTARLLAARLGLAPDAYLVTFQSRFGKAEWLQPYTEPTLQRLARDGVRRVDVICPGFVSDCLETLEEIAVEARHAFLAAGGKRYDYIGCLNERPGWIAGLATLALQQLAGWPTRTAASMTALAPELRRASGA